VKNNSSILIIEKILKVSNKKAKKIFNKSKTCLFSASYTDKLYMSLFNKHLHKITAASKTPDLNNRGTFFLTFHFLGNLEIIVPHLLEKYNELYILYSNNFFSSSSKYKTFKNPQEIIHSKYLSTNKHTVKLLDYDQPQIIYKLINLIIKGKKILLLFDEFPVQLLKKNNNKIVNYKINNAIAAKVPISFFYILWKTNAKIISIVNIRKGYIKNQIHLLENITYHYNDSNFYDENERILKIIYDFYLNCIKLKPEKLSIYVWMRFYYYIQNTAPTSKIIEVPFGEIKKYNTNGNFMFYSSRKANKDVIMRKEDLKCLKVDFLTVKIVKQIKKEKNIEKLENKYGKDIVKKRLEYLLNENYIIPVK